MPSGKSTSDVEYILSAVDPGLVFMRPPRDGTKLGVVYEGVVLTLREGKDGFVKPGELRALIRRMPSLPDDIFD